MIGGLAARLRKWVFVVSGAGFGADDDRLSPMRAWVFLGMAIVAEVIGTSFLKDSEGFSKLGPTVAALGFYGVALYGLSEAVKTIELGIAYAVWAGVGTALIVLIGWLVFRQSIDAAALIGVGMIVGGVVVINVFSELEA